MKNRCLPGSFKVKKKKTNEKQTMQIDFDVCSAQFFFFFFFKNPYRNPL